MITEHLRELFFELCTKYNANPKRMIRRTRNAMECEQRILIIKDMYAAGAKTWQIKEVLQRGDCAIRNARNKVL